MITNTWQPKGSRKFYVTHDPSVCAGRPCCVHNVTEHCMTDWPQHYRDDTGVTERVCPHGVGHPDPDQPWPEDAWQWVHGCDGCCAAPREPEQPIDNSIALIAAITGGAAAV